MRLHCLVDYASHTAIGEAVEAERFSERVRGLLGRPPPPAQTAMYFAKCRSIHTFGMAYPIDVVFLDRQYTVRRIVQAMKPWRQVYCWHGRHVLEFCAGECARMGIRVGMCLAVMPMDNLSLDDDEGHGQDAGDDADETVRLRV